MTQADRLAQLRAVWRCPAGDDLAAIAVHADPRLELTVDLLQAVADDRALLTDMQCEAVSRYYKLPPHFLRHGDTAIADQLTLLGQLVAAGARSIRLRGEPSVATRSALLHVLQSADCA